MTDPTAAPLAPSIPRAPDGPPVLSYAQERLWFMDAYTPGSTAYTIPEAWCLCGEVDPDALASALRRVAERHEPLRTHYPAGADGRPTAAIAEPSPDTDPVPLAVARAGSDAEVRALVEGVLAEPFDLATGPVARAMLITRTPTEHVLALAVHHVAADGWSTELILSEVTALLTGRPLPELPVRHRDVAAWQRAQPVAADVAYWRDQLAGVVPLELPTDRPRPPVPTHTGAAHEFSVPRAVFDEILRLGRAHRATPYMVLLAAFAVLLGRRARQDDVTIGSPTAGRPEPELDDLVGCFVNMLTLRIDLSGDPTFVELLQRVRSTAGQAFTHQDLPFERLVTELNVPREASRSPLFSTVFSMQSYDSDRVADPALTVTGDLDLPYAVTRFDLELHTAGDGEFLVVYDTALFDAASIVALGEHLGVLLAGIAADPDAPISSHPLLTAAERELRRSWNDTATDLGAEGCLHREVAQRAAAAPDAPAVVHPTGELSHGEIEHRARHLAARLVAAGVSRGDLVAVVMERGWEQVVAVLAINKAGAAYLPVDADLPERRRAELLAIGGCTVALTQPALRARTGLPDGITVVAVTAESGDPAPDDPASPDDLAYVIFTSGSTGTPKGVVIEHRAALNTVRDITTRFGIGPGDRVYASSALSFDLSVYDVYGSLSAGATLVLGRPDQDKDPVGWAATVAAQRVTVWNSVPALMELLVDHVERVGGDLGALRLVLMSGDWIPPTLPDRIRALAPDAEIVSLGGATEASIWSIAHPIGRVEPGATAIPYGRPLANQTFHVLDQGLHDVPVGVPGELHIGGAGLATGYWKESDRTAAAFHTHPRTGQRLYRTGDLGAYRPDGVIRFLGRADAQVKIRGYRIELGEVEAHLRRDPAVAECVVVTHGQGTAATLAAYVEAGPGHTPDHTRLRAQLSSALPAYMVPSSVTTLDALPLTANGKVDRARLPAPLAAAGGDGAPPSTATERMLHALWSDVLDRPDVGIDDDFFELGGHSLLAITLVQRIRDAAGDRTPVAVLDLFTHPTIRRLAAVLTEGPVRGGHLLHRLTPPTGTDPELTCVAVPYGGGGALVYTALAEALPPTHALWSVAMPGHDLGLTDEERVPLEDLAARCVAEIQDRIGGPVALYGHCGVGSALAVEIAVGLQAAGRELDAMYLGGIFPFTRPPGLPDLLHRVVTPEAVRTDRYYADGLTAIGLELDGMDPAGTRTIVRTTRADNAAAERYFTRLLGEGRPARPVPRLTAPIISVAGERDPASAFHEERFREWHLLGDTTAVAVIDEAGHYFLEHRAAELAEVVTTTHRAVTAGEPRDGAHWRLSEVSHAGPGQRGQDGPGHAGPGQPGTGPSPAPHRFLAVTAAQLAALCSAALTLVALPVWVLLLTGSTGGFAAAAAAALLPGLLAAPVAGALTDRIGGRRMLLGAGICAGGIQWALAVLSGTGDPPHGALFGLLALLSVAVGGQRRALTAAAVQLAPKRHLDQAVGTLTLATAAGRCAVPVGAVALLALAGAAGVATVAALACALAVVVTAAVRFPRTQAQPVGSVTAELADGLRTAAGDARLRRLLLFRTVLSGLAGPLVLLLAPLVLAVGTLPDLGLVLLGAAVAAAAGGTLMAVWGGPPRGRMRLALLCTLGTAGSAVLAGLGAGADAPVAVGAGVAGMALMLAMLGGAWAAIVEVTVPLRAQAPVSAAAAALSWAALTLGLGVATAVAVATGDAVPGAGAPLGPLYVTAGLAIALLAGVAAATGAARVVDDGPAATPDDVIGLQTLGRSRTTTPACGAAEPGQEEHGDSAGR